MRHPHASTDRQAIRVHMTPMIDVVFLLLIFFVCTASFQAEELVLPSNLRLPRGSTVELERVVIEISLADANPRFFVNGHRCPDVAQLAGILQALAEIDADLPVILDIADDVPLGSGIDAYDACRIAGFAKIQFAASARERRP